jgi:hypothetical protein
MEFNNRSEQDSDSKQLLNGIILLIAKYSHAISQIGKIPVTHQATELRKDIVKPYMVMMYGKAVTAYRLLNGYTLTDLHPKASGVSNDSFTLYDVVRALYECFLQSSFIIQRSKTPEEIQYMASWWHCRAFSERSILAVNRAISNAQTDGELQFIKDHTLMIDQRYQSYKVADIAAFGKDRTTGLADWPKPSKLVNIAGVSQNKHNYIYKFNSIYAHCEPLSILQVGETAKTGKVDINGAIILHGTYVLYLMAFGLENFAMVFSEVEKMISEDPPLQELIEASKRFWSDDTPKTKKT